MLAAGDHVQVLVNPDAPPRAHQWREGVVEFLLSGGELDEQHAAVRFHGDLDVTPVALSRLRRPAGD